MTGIFRDRLLRRQFRLPVKAQGIRRVRFHVVALPTVKHQVCREEDEIDFVHQLRHSLRCDFNIGIFRARRRIRLAIGGFRHRCRVN